MTLEIGYSWHAYNGLPSRGKWDQRWIERMLSGEEGRPVGGFRFTEVEWDPTDGTGRILVMPFGAYGNDADGSIRRQLHEDLEQMPWCLIIATSDECSLFPWHAFDLPPCARLWVMTPRVGLAYPEGTRFIGEGSPTFPAGPTRQALERDLDLFYSGQVGNNTRRQLALPAIRKAAERLAKSKITVTARFLHNPQGELVKHPGWDDDYLYGLSRSWIAPAPSGTCTQDSFRAYEALEAGCIPILDAISPQGNGGYWEMIEMGDVAPQITAWADLPVMAENLLRDRCSTAAHISARWQQYKRRVLARLHDDVEDLIGLRGWDLPADSITVLVLTSAVPSNPDLSMIQQVIQSVRTNLPGAEILIGCDRPHETQAHRQADYSVFLHRLCMWANTQHNIYPFLASKHSHESGLLKMLMREVKTPYVLLVEHDCPLIAPIDFDACLDEMRLHNLRHLRFSHENRVLDEHAYLYPFGTEPAPATSHIKTVQYSSRPALYGTDLMRELLDTYFADDATCMIESVLYGPFLHADGDFGPTEGEEWWQAASKRHAAAWGRFRSALWAPGPDLAFSGHLDGRAGDPNTPLNVSYPDGETPAGAPQPGTMEI